MAKYLRDNQQAWRLHADGRYSRIHPAEGEGPYSAQGALLETLAR